MNFLLQFHSLTLYVCVCVAVSIVINVAGCSLCRYIVAVVIVVSFSCN